MVGVVGPNGCGKSNIMDAVRWVLGESRASELRGESMQDVIFNGTTQRKPASRASVELVFDNADHRAGGQWSQYAEISVKRVLTRDGSSSYYINNQPVRRRDVQDVFLGTGLGPRAYAIIGQGTISRIIESRPEDLRLFLEEAAGVSKYKERRRETANRLSDTRENLTRVEDILRELNANLDKLQRQAEVANRYQRLQDESVIRQGQLWWLRHQASEEEQKRVQHDMAEVQQGLDARVAELRRHEAELEAVRQAHYAAGDALNQQQGQLYEASAEVGRLESDIRYVAESRQRVSQRMAQLSEQIAQWQTRSDQAQGALQSLSGEAQQAQQRLQQGTEQLEVAQQALPGRQQAAQAAHTALEESRQAVRQLQQDRQVLATQQQGLQQQQAQLVQRQDRLGAEQRALVVPDAQRLTQAQAEQTLAQEAQQAAQQALEQANQRVPALGEARDAAQQALVQAQSALADVQARAETLQALQDRLASDERVGPWLQQRGLSHTEPLWRRLQIESGWETALESALRDRLDARELTDMAATVDYANDAPAARLTFFATAVTAYQPEAVAGLRPLLSLLRISDNALKGVLTHWLAGYWVADNLQAAMAARQALQPGQCVVVPQGHQVTAQSVSLYAPDNESAGALVRQQDIENLRKSERAQALMVDEARQAAQRAQLAYVEGRQLVEQSQQQLAVAQRRLHDAQVQGMRLQQEADAAAQRSGQLGSDLLEVQQGLEAIVKALAQAQTRGEQYEMQLGEQQQRQAARQQAAEQAQQVLEQAQQAARDLERARQEAQFEQRSVAQRQDEAKRQQQTAQQQAQELQQQHDQAQQEWAQLDDSAAQQALQAALALKVEREQALALKRRAYEDLSARMRALDEQRLAVERQIEPQRQRITELQLAEQAARLAMSQAQEHLHEQDTQVIVASVAQDGVSLAQLPEQIERLQRSIQQLGAVNLAALEELTEAQERKTFLDQQSADLNEAIQTLEDAIHKIDMETRDLLGSTFETVNQHFGRMFPELFGGGQAKLLMTGEEILDAGVQVMAQPPGKKNQTIQLLSGGEKALTAIALVFAIFQLNPAPFCLLDEVDAPLDDSNTERYASLVGRMSHETQFLYISHNKISMEKAEQLIGVTMQEQGVSRIVAVDMDTAVGMAQT